MVGSGALLGKAPSIIGLCATLHLLWLGQIVDMYLRSFGEESLWLTSPNPTLLVPTPFQIVIPSGADQIQTNTAGRH